MKKIKTKVCVSMVALLLFGCLMTGCGKKEEHSLRIGYFPNITHSQALIMKEQGVLEKDWMKVTR